MTNKNEISIFIKVNKEESLDLIYKIIDVFKQLNELIPEWNNYEKDKLNNEFAKLVSKIIKVSD